MKKDLYSYFKKTPDKPNPFESTPKVTKPKAEKVPYTHEPVRNIENSASKYESIKESEFDLPKFLLKSQIKDSQKRPPSDPEYDPSTLFIPPNEKFTPAMQQYWDIKKQHYDKIVLFKLGKFYELFYLDAIAVQGILDLKWMGMEQKKAHVGFPEKSLEKYAGILIENGLKLVVVEQTETTLKNRVAKIGKTVGREIAEVLTKSTFSAYYMSSDFEPNYLLAAVEIQEMIGITLADLSTSLIVVGEVSQEEFRNLLARTRPAEFVYNPHFVTTGLMKIVKSIPVPPVLSVIKNSEEWNPIKLHEYFPEEIPSVISGLPMHSSLRSLVGCCHFLKSSLLFDRIVPVANFQVYTTDLLSQKHMILDSEALEHLEILEANDGKEKSVKGSVYEFINKCVTPFGKRLLKKWLIAPLLHIQSIESRLDAVEELSRNQEILTVFATVSKKFPDLERILARLSSYSIKTNSKAVYFEDVGASKLKEVSKFLAHMKDLEILASDLTTFGFSSSLLNSLVKNTENLGRFPILSPICDKLLSLIVWNNKDEPEPVADFCEEYDIIKDEVHKIEAVLSEELQKERARFNNNPEIRFVDSKFRSELEVPLYLVEKHKPAEYEETSARSGFQRYYTKKIKSLADQLEITEDKLKTALNPFIVELMRLFYKDYLSWKNGIDLIAEFDCLASLAKLSVSTPFTMTRPRFSNAISELTVNGLTHPILASRMNNFVPNDLKFTEDKHCYVITGPNMGGKSTVLRELGIATILAQMGSFVPAEELIISPVDFIFTRLGASDSLIEGKSTFFMEMEEAGKFFRRGSEKSLVIMDELGRGTSTQDGSALALAVLQALTDKVKPRTVFTTHYHMILSDIRDLKGVYMTHMDSILNKSDKTVTFLYKLISGECPRSYGLNVARLAGIPESILSIAETKAEEVENGQKLVQITGLLKKLKIAGISDPIPYLEEYLS